MSMTAIRHVDPRSPAHRAGVHPGETLTHVNGKPILDVLDYKFYTYDPRLVLTLSRPDGSSRTVRIRKSEGEDLGLDFETYLMDRARSCANRCIFCFVDQLPPGMRKTLYFKDDDARLSFLMGNYLTLTNLSPREVQRIIDLRISPINVSVHTTNPDLRVRMLGNPRAGESIAIMERFCAAGITMNCQIVSCPGINDGPELDRTMRDLAAMHPAIHSVSVVPVGVTKFREDLQPYTTEQAIQVVDQVEAFGKACLEKLGSTLIWCSDEFYLLAGRSVPEESYFEEFTQLDNGVGMLRLLECEFDRALALFEPEELKTLPFSIATGVSAAPLLEKLVKKANLPGKVYSIANRFFGETITVAGLVTGQDLISQLKDRDLGERLLISANMLRSGEQVFLDDVTVIDVERALQVPVTAVPQDGYDLLDAMLGLPIAGPAARMPDDCAEYYLYN